jgi:hypothetical protein
MFRWLHHRAWPSHGHKDIKFAPPHRSQTQPVDMTRDSDLQSMRARRNGVTGCFRWSCRCRGFPRGAKPLQPLLTGLCIA